MQILLSVAVLAGLTIGTPGILPVANPIPLRLIGPGHADSKSVSIGTVKIGNFDVEVFQEGKVLPGKEATFQLKLNGQGEPDAIRVWVGIESSRGSIKGKAHKHGQTIEVHCDVPEQLPEGSKVWVELETGSTKTKGAVDYKKE